MGKGWSGAAKGTEGGKEGRGGDMLVDRAVQVLLDTESDDSE